MARELDTMARLILTAAEAANITVREGTDGKRYGNLGYVVPLDIEAPTADGGKVTLNGLIKGGRVVFGPDHVEAKPQAPKVDLRSWGKMAAKA
jgi:hypothetical protein